MSEVPGWRTRRRRIALFVAGCALLGTGAAVNIARHAEPQSQTLTMDTASASNRFVAYMQQPDEELEVEATPDACEFCRHKGEEGQMGTPTRSGLYALKGPTDALQGERYAPTYAEPGFKDATEDPRSTFSVDVDTAGYSNVRRILIREARLPPPNAVRVEEMVNYFNYDYPEPAGEAPFSVTSEVGPCPWNENHRLVHIGVQAREVEPDAVPPRNLVFLVDVSGSMDSPDKLPLVKQSLARLTEELRSEDRIALVVYAGAAGVVLPPTGDPDSIRGALRRLEAGGSTNGGQGIELAYALAEGAFIDGGINRVILASDGDFNVGLTSDEALFELIERKREGGVFLSVLGFGMGNLQDHTMEQLADRGNGSYAYIDSEKEAEKVLVQEANGTLVTIAKDVKLQLEFDGDAVSRYRLVGYHNRRLQHHDFDDDTRDAGEIGSGHTVTALYEVDVRAGSGEALAQLALRYKEPDGSTSQRLDFEIADGAHALAETSAEFRFSAAVATFGQLLARSAHTRLARFRSVADLAIAARGDDPMCRRAEFVELVFAAAAASGTPLSGALPACESSHAPLDLGPATDWGAFWLEVLRFLPPLLGLPLFLVALWPGRKTVRAASRRGV